MASSPHQLAEAYAFSKLAEHLRMRTDVQNIDVMILAGFCRNCLSKWCRPSSRPAAAVARRRPPTCRILFRVYRYHAGALHHGIDTSYDQAVAHVYGMPLKEWKKLHQSPATEEQLKLLEQSKAGHAQHEAPSSTASQAAPAPPARMLSDVCCQPVPGRVEEAPPVQVTPVVRRRRRNTHPPANEAHGRHPSRAGSASHDPAGRAHCERPRLCGRVRGPRRARGAAWLGLALGSGLLC